VLEEPIFWQCKAAGVNGSQHFKKSELLQLKVSRSHSRVFLDPATLHFIHICKK
jgi:hypothetical protein